MTKISTEDFVKMLNLDGWELDTDRNIDFDDFREEDNGKGDGGTVKIPHICGYLTNELTRNGITISYTEAFSVDKYNFDTLVTHTDLAEDGRFRVDGVVVVDNLGKDNEYLLSPADLYDIVIESPLSGRISYFDYECLRSKESTDIDLHPDGSAPFTMRTFVLTNDGAPNVRFTGKLVASMSSRNEEEARFRWTDLDLYKTAGGNFVCSQVGVTSIQGERDRHRVKVCKTETEVIEFFGHGWLAKELYAECEIDDVIDVN